MIELLEEDLKNEKLKYYKITGDTPKHIRVEQAETFNTDYTPVFLVSLKAGGTGLNLIGADEFLSGELGGLVSMSREDLLDIMTEKP